MGRIKRLSEEVASQVAAGEVVERPASVVKELVENSIDAGATRVEVEYRKGGSGYLAVTDNGRGMDREDAERCLERHATSKIRTGRDLETVATFGFRGEAVPSVASVSKFRLTTREAGAEAGTEIVVAGGKIESVRACGCAEGTRIEVRNLFYNLPARRKFLRGERTEAAHIEQVFQIAALANPNVRFSLERDGRQTRLLAAGTDLRTRVRDLCGTEFLGSLFEIAEFEHGGVEFAGLLARPGHGRGDRSQQYWFVNGRAISSPILSQPLREAYGNALPKGMHPAAVMFVRMDPREVDCNVHPAKREVRFRDGIGVREAVGACVRVALDGLRNRGSGRGGAVGRAFPEADRRVPVVRAGGGALEKADDGRRDGPAEEARNGGERFELTGGRRSNEQAETALVAGTTAPIEERVERVFIDAPVEAVETDELLETTPERFRFVGVLAGRYVTMEDAAGMVLLDFRAAQERIWFERTLREMGSGAASSQRLLLPAVVELSPRDEAWVNENAEALRRVGMWVEPFGSGTVKIDGVPPMLAGAAASEALVGLIDDGRASGSAARGRAGSRAVEEAIARSVARFAPAQGLPLETEGLRTFLAELMACDLPYTCPGGKPTMVHFSLSELERKFGR
ncbi:MAG: DNA mismatch repair endonuclease MutL [Chthoniobacterales bacterium]